MSAIKILTSGKKELFVLLSYFFVLSLVGILCVGVGFMLFQATLDNSTNFFGAVGIVNGILFVIGGILGIVMVIYDLKVVKKANLYIFWFAFFLDLFVISYGQKFTKEVAELYKNEWETSLQPKYAPFGVNTVEGAIKQVTWYINTATAFFLFFATYIGIGLAGFYLTLLTKTSSKVTINVTSLFVFPASLVALIAASLLASQPAQSEVLIMAQSFCSGTGWMLMLINFLGLVGLHFEEKVLCYGHGILSGITSITMMIFADNFNKMQQQTVRYMIDNWGEFYHIGLFDSLNSMPQDLRDAAIETSISLFAILITMLTIMIFFQFLSMSTWIYHLLTKGDVDEDMDNFGPTGNAAQETDFWAKSESKKKININLLMRFGTAFVTLLGICLALIFVLMSAYPAYCYNGCKFISKTAILNSTMDNVRSLTIRHNYSRGAVNVYTFNNSNDQPISSLKGRSVVLSQHTRASDWRVANVEFENSTVPRYTFERDYKERCDLQYSPKPPTYILPGVDGSCQYGFLSLYVRSGYTHLQTGYPIRLNITTENTTITVGNASTTVMRNTTTPEWMKKNQRKYNETVTNFTMVPKTTHYPMAVQDVILFTQYGKILAQNLIPDGNMILNSSFGGIRVANISIPVDTMSNSVINISTDSQINVRNIYQGDINAGLIWIRGGTVAMDIDGITSKSQAYHWIDPNLDPNIRSSDYDIKDIVTIFESNKGPISFGNVNLDKSLYVSSVRGNVFGQNITLGKDLQVNAKGGNIVLNAVDVKGDIVLRSDEGSVTLYLSRAWSGRYSIRMQNPNIEIYGPNIIKLVSDKTNHNYAGTINCPNENFGGGGVCPRDAPSLQIKGLDGTYGRGRVLIRVI